MLAPSALDLCAFGTQILALSALAISLVGNIFFLGGGRATKNAGLENAAPSKMQGWNMQDQKCETKGRKMRDQPSMESQTTHDVYLVL